MTIYKGRTSPARVEREYPHWVDASVPVKNLARRLDAMNDWHSRRGIVIHRGRRRRVDERDHIRWCFADAKTADDFVAQFGGTRVSDDPMPTDDAQALVEWGKRNIQT